MAIECCRMVIECCYSGYSRDCVTMFNEAFVVAVVCIEHDIVVIHHCALFINSYVIRRREVGGGGGVELRRGTLERPPPTHCYPYKHTSKTDTPTHLMTPHPTLPTMILV